MEAGMVAGMGGAHHLGLAGRNSRMEDPADMLHSQSTRAAGMVAGTEALHPMGSACHRSRMADPAGMHHRRDRRRDSIRHSRDYRKDSIPRVIGDSSNRLGSIQDRDIRDKVILDRVMVEGIRRWCLTEHSGWPFYKNWRYQGLGE